MNTKDLKNLVSAVNILIRGFGCSNPEHQKKIEELQAAMKKVKDIADEIPV